MKTPVLVSFLTLLLICSSCSTNQNEAVRYEKVNGQKLLICDVDKITETRTLKLSEIVEEAGYIRPEYDTSALIGWTAYNRFSNGHLLVSNMQNRLFLFDREGRFIKKWIPGRGPEEYLVPGDPVYLDGEVFVFDYPSKKVWIYHLETEEVDVVRLSEGHSRCILLPDKTFLSLAQYTTENTPSLLCHFDRQGNMLDRYEARTPNSYGVRRVGSYSQMYAYEDAYHLQVAGNDTLMRYDLAQDQLEPIAVFESRSFLKTRDKLLREMEKVGASLANLSPDLTGYRSVTPELESEQYYFLSVFLYGDEREKETSSPWYLAERKLCMVNKKTLEAFYVELENDFWGNMTLRPPGNTPFWFPVVVESLSTQRLLKKFSHALEQEGNAIPPEQRGEMQELMNTVQENDNSLMFWYRLKK